MDMEAHDAIARRLEASKSAGWLSDYLVAWHGINGALKPNVTVWRGEDRTDADVYAHVVRSLFGLVPNRSIVIADR